MCTKQNYTIVFLSILLLYVWPANLMAQVNADFTVDDSLGCESLIVRFTNLSTGSGALNYFWDFGNGNTSTLTNPQIAFVGIGEYTVTLIVHDSGTGKSDTLIKENFIQVFNNPQPAINTLSNRVGCPILTINFQSQIILADAPIAAYVWDFGDGSFSSDSMPKNSYSTPGTYTVSLVVTDTNGCSGNAVKYNYVTLNPGPHAGFTSSTPYSCLDTLTVKFTNQSSGIGNLQYNWLFGDGWESSEINPSHLYIGEDSRSVQLKVIDETGCIDSIIKTNAVILKPVSQDIAIENGPVCRNTPIKIINNSQGINTYSWNFGDGETSNQEHPLKKYAESGWFTIRVITSFYSVCADTLIDSVYVDPVKAKFVSDKQYNCQIPTTVHFTDQSVNASSWLWKFGNGQIKTQQNPELIYDQNMSLVKNKTIYFSDTLIVTSSNFCNDTIVKDSNMAIFLPMVYFTPNDSSSYEKQVSGCTPVHVDFLNKSFTSNEADPFNAWEWELGDGSTQSTEDVSYDYQQTGSFNVKLTAVNASGCRNSFNATIKTGTPQTANFTYHAPAVICGSEAVEFINTSVEDSLINRWAWQFSDNGNTSLKEMFYTFTDTGYASATLTVFYNGCEGSTITKDSITYVKGPAGRLETQFDCVHPFDYLFTAHVNGADSSIWEFGDGGFDSTQNQTVTHTYSTTGGYNVKFSAVNTDQSCQLTVDQPINVSNLHGVLDVLGYGCRGEAVTFDPTMSQDVNSFYFDGNFYKYLWDFGDSTETEASMGIMTHVYANKGIYKAKMTVFAANNCSEELIRTIHIFKPSAKFNVGLQQGCLPLPVQYADASTSDTTLVLWNWDFGDGQLDTLQNPEHVFQTNGKFNSRLIVTDAALCKDTLTKKGLIMASGPLPVISLASHNGCLNDSLLFVNQSTGFGLTASWNFGDGKTSSIFSPKHAYADTGSYDVSLYMIDSLGCDTTFLSTDFITIHDLPKPDFTSDLYQTSCYPALVKFNGFNVGDSVISWDWNFGDETPHNNQKNPMHTYYKPGKYDVQLRNTSIFGCKGTTLKSGFLNIGGPYAKMVLPDIACKGVPALISLADSLNVYDFEWLFDDGSTSTIDSTFKTYLSFGTKPVLLNMRSDAMNTCNKIIRDSLVVPVIISRFTVNDSMDCVPFTTNFTDLSTNAKNWYWNFVDGGYSDVQNPSYNFQNSGIFNVMLRVEEEHQCADSSFKNITVFSLPEIGIHNDTLICKNDTIQLWVTGGNQYQWISAEGITETTSDNPRVFPSQTQTFYVIVTDENNCSSDDSVLVQVQQPPTSTILNPDTVQLIVGESVDLMAEQTGGDYFSWTPEIFITCIQCLQTTAKPLNDTMSYFSVTDENGCFTVRDSVYLKVDYKFSLDVPSAFTPNNDKVNDQVFVKGWGIKELREFTIYDANNKQIFSASDLSVGWDGTWQGKRLEPGIYYYVVRVMSYDNSERIKKGYIYLLK